MSGFYAAPVRDLGDPAADPPGTVRVDADPTDQHAHLFDRDARRAVKTAQTRPAGQRWVLISGARDITWFYDDEVASWPVVPAYAVSAPWTLAAAQPAPATPAHERGDLDVEAFRG
ncbi:hypothetical protein I4I73_21325 [Pseudonocardia sp. KRD-184]|uniref:Uncharacterized protein n=1 Tax=Pseudonocardia oceani TaxID=2792013 RepID=A0ABS6UK12_9PSEU|nr:hypothetical protein [Pseudonocardia oceani]MBW0090514.1 hypothetical protein [Pseudonocardia oceani]MBW0098533.1 hypothetical protein [Pseudonocardia oceani]MBW0124373.1 hypothetical protein [Pseudonocardia oceani]MBW0131143.1 hypothetical protein [Pseudonocardia oceani]MBW0132595.1 hypothetical protein [Pseudonocardia oceani]